MEYYDTIIVGAGPAGSTCAWKLAQMGRSALMLDRSPFPRLKLCAGWVTEEVWRDLQISPAEYPHSLLKLSTRREAIFNRSLRPGWQWLRWLLPWYSPSPEQRGKDQPEPLASPNFH